MNSNLACTGRPVGIKIRYFFWSHPEWWSVALCWSAWAVMLLYSWQYAGHGAHHRMGLAQETAFWMLMVAAMMLPRVVNTVRFTAAASLWARRHRAIVGFLLGYFAPWLGLGIVAAALRQRPWTHAYAAPALGFAIAALWQRTGMHWRALMACRRSWPLAPLGWRADRDCLRYGGFIGAACVRTCWPLMLACAFTGHSLIAMSGGMAVGAMERRRKHRPRTRAILAATLALASYYVALAVLDQGFTIRLAIASSPPRW